MELSDKLIKPIIETKYLNVENSHRYRVIIRYFYLQYEKLKYWMYQDEVYEELSSHEYFKDYTLDQCQQDLNALVEWKNLLTMQDTRKVATIEEFKNKKFRYQLSEYSVEIERMVIRLENLVVEGASLEPSLLERIRNHTNKINEISLADSSTVYHWWNDLNNDFIRLNQNYQDYMRDLNGIKAEELMRTKEFLVFKDKLIEYLRSFVKSLQLNVSIIEQNIRNTDQETIDLLLDKVLEYELSIPRLEVEIDKQEIMEGLKGRLDSIKDWFVDQDGTGAEAEKVFDLTNEIIRKITRYAAGISQFSNQGGNRKEEYYKLAQVFSKCKDINEAHCLCANVFGVEKPFHIKGDLARETESINSGVYDEKPSEITVRPRTRTYHERTNRSPIIDHRKEKEEQKKAELKRIEREEKLLESFVVNKSIDFANLPILEPEVRNTLLIWLSKALESKTWQAKTQDGRVYKVKKPKDNKKCKLKCLDGTFTMPSYKIVFEE